MFKKILLLTVALAGFTTRNTHAMHDDDTRKPWVKKLVCVFNEEQTAIMNSLQHETKLAGVAMACHFSTLLLAQQMSKSMAPAEKVLLAAPTMMIGMYTGKKITNYIHELMDPKEKHKTAHAVGFGSAFWLLDFLMKRSLI
jgi:hypothetical protein